MASDPKKKKPVPVAKDESLSPEDMAALLDEAIGDDEDDLDLEVDGPVDDATSQAAIAAIMSSASTPDDDDDDPAMEEEDEPDAPSVWEAVADLAGADIELIQTDEALTDDHLWDPIQDADAEDVVIEATTQERPPDAWGPVGSEAPEGDGDDGLTVPSPPPPEVPPAVSLLIGEHAVLAEPRTPADALPWRGTASVFSPELPDQFYVADVTRAVSGLLVAAWEWVEDEPGGRTVRVRLADDGEEIELETTAPHEPLVALDVALGPHNLAVRAALTVERGQRGLRLGRDVLAGRFTVDPSTSNWPKPTDD